MNRNTKGRTGCHQATPMTSNKRVNFSSILSRIKALVITLAVWGWFPLGLADRINNWGGHRDE